MLEFDKETHIYKLDAAVIPSVTQVLCESGLVDARWFDSYSRWRGSAVHAACWYDDQNDFNEEHFRSTPELAALMGYVDGYRRFKEDHEFVPTSIEVPLFHPAFRYAGTSDRAGTIHGDKPTILDLKSGVHLGSHPIQLSAYAHLEAAKLQTDPYKYERVAIYLSADGKYKLRTAPRGELANDYNVFLAALSVTNWKRAHGVKWQLQ